MTALDAVLAEIDAELARLAPIHEGLRDYAALDLTPAAMTEVTAALAVYDARVAALTAAKLALEILLAQGPALELPPVDNAVYDDLVANRDTIAAALAEFTLNEAATVDIVFGTPEEQQKE